MSEERTKELAHECVIFTSSPQWARLLWIACRDREQRLREAQHALRQAMREEIDGEWQLLPTDLRSRVEDAFEAVTAGIGSVNAARRWLNENKHHPEFPKQE